MDTQFENYDPDKIKKMYDEFYSTEDFKGFPIAEKYFIKSLVKKMKLPQHTKILDIGCGTGKYTHFFSQLGMAAVGIDISPQGIAVAREKYPASTFQVGDATKLDFEPRSSDVIFCSGLSLFNETNLDTLKPLMSHFLSLLKQGGLFVFVKTSALTDKHSKNKSRLDYSLNSFMDFFKKLPGIRPVLFSATYPQVFPLLGGFGFSKLITRLSTLNTKMTRIPVRVCIVLKYEE